MAEERKGKAALAFVCGTPNSHCNGRSCSDSDAKGDGYGKIHSTQAQAKQCLARYMTLQGYKPIGNNAWDPGNGGPILVTSKRPQRAKAGKVNGTYLKQPLKVRDVGPLPKKVASP